MSGKFPGYDVRVKEIAEFFTSRPWALPVLVGAAVAWNLAWAAWSIRRIRRAGRTVLARAPEGALFVERWTSGASGQSLLSRLGGASNCLLVVLTKERLLIRPHCPFNLFLSPRFDLDHDLPLAGIRTVKAAGGRVEVELPDRILTLRLRDPARFLGVWGRLRGV